MTETETTARILPEYKFVLGQEMSEAVHQALGAASVCWEPMDCTGVFQEHRARQIAGELMEIAMQYAQAYPESLKPSAATSDGGQWLCIAFMGHLEYTGYVTEITKHGQPAYRIDLPEKIWGGNPLAYVTHAASAWFSDRPVTEESARKAWEAERARQAAWEARQQRYALEAAAQDSDDGDLEDAAAADEDEHDEPWSART